MLSRQVAQASSPQGSSQREVRPTLCSSILTAFGEHKPQKSTQTLTTDSDMALATAQACRMPWPWVAADVTQVCVGQAAAQPPDTNMARGGSSDPWASL